MSRLSLLESYLEGEVGVGVGGGGGGEGVGEGKVVNWRDGAGQTAVFLACSSPCADEYFTEKNVQVNINNIQILGKKDSSFSHLTPLPHTDHNQPKPTTTKKKDRRPPPLSRSLLIPSRNHKRNVPPPYVPLRPPFPHAVTLPITKRL